MKTTTKTKKVYARSLTESEIDAHKIYVPFQEMYTKHKYNGDIIAVDCDGWNLMINEYWVDDKQYFALAEYCTEDSQLHCVIDGWLADRIKTEEDFRAVTRG